MSYDLEHKEIYMAGEPALVIDGDTIVGAEVTRIYQEEDGDFVVSVTHASSDLDPGQTSAVRVNAFMFRTMLDAHQRFANGYRLLKRAPKCNHPYAKPDGHAPPRYICTECGKEVDEADYT